MDVKKKTVTAYFEADHDRLDLLLKNFIALKDENFAIAKPFFKTFLQGLKRHIVWEEDVLFPAFELKTGIRDAGPTAVMRFEHREIGQALEALHDKVRRADAACEAETSRLIELLGAHNQKEEQVLYPSLDSQLDEGEAAEIFRAMEAIPAERYITCCGGAHHH